MNEAPTSMKPLFIHILILVLAFWIPVALLATDDIVKDEVQKNDGGALLAKLARMGSQRAGMLLGDHYFARGDFTNVVKYLTPVAYGDSVGSQFVLGMAYNKTRDDGPASKWILKAAFGGLTQAQAVAGVLYINGLGVQQNYAAGLKWLKLAASRGDLTARTTLGNIYSKGIGVPQDEKEASYWLNKTGKN